MNRLARLHDCGTGACCPTSAMPPALRELLADSHPELLERCYGCGSPLPPALEGRMVLDLGCGTGRTCTCFHVGSARPAGSSAWT